MMNMNFEENLQRLNDIIDEMEQNSTSIDHSLKLYQEAIELAAAAGEILSNARQHVSILQGEVKQPFQIEGDDE